MSEVPDKVIEQAVEAALTALVGTDVRALRVDGGYQIVGDDIAEATVAAAAPVIAAWARNQERERIKRLIEQRTKEAADDYRRDPEAYHRGREDELLMVADEIGSADIREDGK